MLPLQFATLLPSLMAIIIAVLATAAHFVEPDWLLFLWLRSLGHLMAWSSGITAMAILVYSYAASQW